jgi:thymidylate synthase
LNRFLIGRGQSRVETVANTIFPASLWRPNRPRQELFDRYLRLIPSIRQHSANRYGTYFERLIQFPGPQGQPINQLEHIVTSWHAGVRRRTALQASIFAPHVDHTRQRRRGFPCLHQVAFFPTQGALKIVGIYTTQYLIERALGNWLGLQRLGEFMAAELGLTLTHVQCIAATEIVDAPKRELRPLLLDLRSSLRAP